MNKQVRTISLLAALAMLLPYGAARADYLVVTATGTVLSGQDADSSGILGFGISPTRAHPEGTAVGQPVTMTFVLDLSHIPPDACLPAGTCSEPGNRAYYFANTPPASHWISATDSIGGRVVPEFAPHGGNFTGPTDAQLWTAYGDLPLFNALDVESYQTVRTIDPLGGGAYEETLSTDSSVVIIESYTTRFLNGLSVGQSFSWNSSEDDGISIGDIRREIDTATCPNSHSLCTSDETLLTANVEIQLDSVTGKVVKSSPLSAPEPGTLLLMGLGLAGAGLARRKRT